MYNPVKLTPTSHRPGMGEGGGFWDWARETFIDPVTGVVVNTLPTVQTGIQTGIQTGVQNLILDALGNPAGTQYDAAGRIVSIPATPPTTPPIERGMSPTVALGLGVAAVVVIGMMLRKRGR